MENEYIGIKEFAELAGVSSQSIYKRIKKENNPIQPFLKKVGNQFTISKTALLVLYNVEIEKTTIKPSLKVEQPIEKEEQQPRLDENSIKKDTAYDKLINILQEQLEAQRKEMDNKNKIIETLTEALKDSQKMLDQAQQLNAIDKKRILQLEAGTTEEKENNNNNTEEEKEKEIKKEKKKGFFSWFK